MSPSVNIDFAFKATEMMDRIILNALIFDQPSSARALTILATIHKTNGLKDQAKSLLEDAISINSSYMDAIKLLLDIYQEDEDMEKLREYAEIAHELSPENSKYILILARCNLEEGKVDLAEKMFKRAMENRSNL